MAAQVSSISRRHAPARRPFVYLKSVVRHPAHLVVVSWLPLFALLTGWVTTALTTFVVLEVVLVSVVSTWPRYRRWVDERLFAKECAVASVERSRILGQMTPLHSQELEHLENLADRVRDRLTPGESPLDGTDCFGVDDLLAMYARSAIAYARGRSALGDGRGNGERIAGEMRSLAQALMVARTQQSRALTTRRLEVLRMRADRWEKSCEELDVIGEQLALIADLVRLTCEHAGAPVPSGSIHDDLERALSSMSDTEQTIGELTGLLANDTSVDSRVLRRGRLPRMQATTGVRVATEPPAAAGPAVATAVMQCAAEPELEDHHVSPPLRTMRCTQKA